MLAAVTRSPGEMVIEDVSGPGRARAGHVIVRPERVGICGSGFLAQALISKPRYLLIDELSLGLAPVVVTRLIPVIAAVAEAGAGVLLIEQFATVALGLAHRAYIMEGGRIRFSGLASELRDQPDLLRSACLLRGSDAPAPRPVEDL